MVVSHFVLPSTHSTLNSLADASNIKHLDKPPTKLMSSFAFIKANFTQSPLEITSFYFVSPARHCLVTGRLFSRDNLTKNEQCCILGEPLVKSAILENKPCRSTGRLQHSAIHKWRYCIDSPYIISMHSSKSE